MLERLLRAFRGKPSAIAAPKAREPAKPPKAEPQPSANCPHCGHTFEKMPSRKRKCPTCGESVIVKKDPATEQKILMTEKQASAADVAWKQIYFVRRWARRLEITESEVHSRHAKMAPGTSPRDALWSIMNERSQGASDHTESKMALFEMGLFLHEEGRDNLKVMQEAARAQLREIRSVGIRDEVKIFSEGGCDTCRALDGTVLTIEQALKTMPIPCPECVHDVNDSGRGWCRCMYFGHLD